MTTKLFDGKKCEPKEYLNLKAFETVWNGRAGVQLDSVDRSGNWRKTILFIDECGVVLFKSADNAGVRTYDDGVVCHEIH